jgi:hypothetical protein
MKLYTYGRLLGKIAEYATSVSLNTPYNGMYKHSFEPVYQLANRFSQNSHFVGEFKGCLHAGEHCPLTGLYHPPYDFIHPENEEHGLSVKSILRNNASKISPSCIGQPNISKFCNVFNINNQDEYYIKYHIENRVGEMLDAYWKHTFQYPILFYHAKRDDVVLIKPKEQIPWFDLKYKFTHQLKNKLWKESTTLYVDDGKSYSKTIGEFQFHNHRNCIKFRFSLLNILHEFPQCFTIKQW